MDYNKLFTDRIKQLGSSVIREILKVVNQPGMVSLAGGLPAPDSFPMDIIEEISNKVIKKYGTQAFQYDMTEGFRPLREALGLYFNREGLKVNSDNIIITSGSQGVLDSIGKVFISNGDKVAVGAPTYLGAIQAFKPYEPEFIQIEMDNDGLKPDSLENVLKKHKIKFIYTVPTFQNPTGRSMTQKRREDIAGIIVKYSALLIEDDPYSALRYRGSKLPTIRSLAPFNVIYATTLSKVLAPGFRIGICIAPPEIQKWLVTVKQGVDLHANTFSQAIAAEYISGGYLEQQIPKIISLYKPKQEAMLSAMEKYFPDVISWSKPEGGMFIWAEGPKGLDMEKVYWKGIERKVAFVPGKYFYSHQGTGLETMRLNYTMSTLNVIDKAIKTLGELIKKELSA